MEPMIVVLVTAVTTVGASSGFWAWLMRKTQNKSSVEKLLLGLAYDKIIHRGMQYIDRGWISKDEYEEFRKYLYEPYIEVGGNGVAQRIMEDVARLRLRSPAKYAQINNSHAENNLQEIDHE